MSKIKIVQLESFYPQFMQEIYTAFLGLQGLSFEAQIHYLLGSGFSGGHNVVPYLNPSRWETQYIIANCPWSQQRWATENGIAGGTSPRDLLAAQLRQMQPDILYLSDIPGFDFSILDELSKRPHVVGWHATALSDHTPWAAFDLVLSGINRIRQSALERGAKAAAEFMPAAPPYRCGGPLPATSGGVVFSGSFYGGIHDARAQQFRQLSQQLGNAALDIYSPSRFATAVEDRITFFPAVYGNEVIRLYSRYAIVLDSRGEFNLSDGGEARETSNMRVFEATRAGSLLLTERSPNLQKYFAFGAEIETYASFEELVEKIRFYADPANEEARCRIAEAGLQRVIKEHLIEHRAAWLEDILNQQFALHSSPRPLQGTITEPQFAAPQGFLLKASPGDLIFALAQAERAKQEAPEASRYLLCLDQETHDRANRLGLDLHLLTPKDLTLGGVSANRLHSRDNDLCAVALTMRHLFATKNHLQRITYLAADLALRHLPLDFAADVVVAAEYDFGSNLGHAAEALGTLAAGFLSVARSQAGSALLDHLLARETPIALADLVAKASESGLTVRNIAIQTPWSRPPADEASLALLGPLALVQNSQWQFLPFDSAPDWQDYLNRIYVPYLRGVQALYGLYPELVGFGEQQMTPSWPALTDYLARHEYRVRSGYRMLSESEYKAFATQTSGWDTPSVAAIQHQAFRALLDEFRAGRQRADMGALTRIVARIATPTTSILEEGCGSGYNSELIRLAAGNDIHYSGIDIATCMVDLARATYPNDRFEVMRSEALAFPNGAFDIVLNGASLMHTIDYEKALAEARRVASHYVVLHTVTIADFERNVYFEKNAYGSKVPEVCFASRELNQLLGRQKLLPVLLENSIDYDLNQAVGVPSKSVSIACYCLQGALAKPNHYCTYFDANYLPRGILMIRSLLRHDATAVIHVLCLDETTATALTSLSPNIKPLLLPELLAADPEFGAARDNRSQIEWYFTATSCLVNYLIRQNSDVDRIIYLDADLYFFAAPEFLIDEAKNTSVQIIEHRFSSQWANLAIFGRFNVGWISFTNSEEGRRVIADYRASCLEWCYDRLEGDRFGDQKYLDKWPATYPHCCVSNILGANVAWWNISNWQPSKFDDRVYVGANLLIFYHFQEIKRLESGEYATKKDPAEYGAYYEMVYAPYIAELAKADTEVRPLIEKLKISDIRYNSW